MSMPGSRRRGGQQQRRARHLRHGRSDSSSATHGPQRPVRERDGPRRRPKEMASFGNTGLSPFNSYGRGSGVEVGVGTTLPNNPDVNQAIIVGLAEQAAAPKTPGGNTFPDNSLTKEGGPVNADPLLFASLLKGQAAGNWDPTSCPVATQDPTQPGFPVDTRHHGAQRHAPTWRSATGTSHSSSCSTRVAPFPRRSSVTPTRRPWLRRPEDCRPTGRSPPPSPSCTSCPTPAARSPS